MESAADNVAATTSAAATETEQTLDTNAAAGSSRAAQKVETAPTNAPQEESEVHAAVKEGEAEAEGGQEEGGPQPAGATTDAPTLSKKQQKRALKRAQWEEGKYERRQQERARKKQRKKEKKVQLHQDIANGIVQPKPKSPPRTPFPIDIVVDLGFDELMADKELRSICLQLSHLYNAQRHCQSPAQNLFLCGRGSHLGSSYVKPGGDPPKPSSPVAESSLLTQSVMGQHMEVNWRAAWRRWTQLSVLDEGGLEALIEQPESSTEPPPLIIINHFGGKHDAAQFEKLKQHRKRKEDIVYLTADSDNTLESLEEGKMYVIGGIVDKNRYKRLCANKAAALGIVTAKLPINDDTLGLAEGEQVSGRKVLTVNQVVEIMLRWCETRDWNQALAKTFPSRKVTKTDTVALEDEEEAMLNDG